MPTPALRHAALLVAVFLCPVVGLAQPPGGKGTVDFNRDVRPILSNNCFACHGPDEKVRKADLRLDTHDGAIEAVVVPGKPGESELLKRVMSSEQGVAMPPLKSGKKLTPREVAILTQWIKEGAPYSRHWAYVKPVRAQVPAFSDPKAIAWVKNPIDAFLLARLQKEGLSPSAEADRYALIRRVTLDLTGLPPTIAEVDAFVNDRSPDAYEKLVDRLLARPAFGEHWARMWLDLARYADSAGYADDPLRTIWKYRDWVIGAFNSNMPFDQFTIEQLAGDLLPNATDDQRIATAFHRNTMTNSEGGTNDEEFRNVAVVDRVNTTMTVWMGTSIACCQCHSHKYDPLTQKEFFQLFAFLNNTADADRPDESPTLAFWSPAQRAQKTGLEKQIAAFEVVLAKAKPTALKADRDQLAALKKKLAGIKPVTVPVMQELPANQRRKTRLQFRGNFLDLGDQVTEGVPAVFNPLPKGAPLNRLTLAKWLVSPENPLTARVVANRFWEQIFGIGLVRTSEEFGIQGELPSHPELLDWLACELIQPTASGPLTGAVPASQQPPGGGRSPGAWDVKRFLKLVVMSAAYRQSAKVTPALFERDPDNRLLARGPRVRLSAEMVRDQALAAAGLLSSRMNGPSVRPPQPNLGVSAAFGGSIDWQTSTGEDRYRRGVYTQWRRSNPYPSMSTFDAPNRDTCVVRRARTNTPLQALVTMNDPVYIEAAQALARKAMNGGSSIEQGITLMFRSCLARPPRPEELKRLVALYHEAQAKFRKAPDRGNTFAPPPMAMVDPSAHAAMTLVASVILNLDEVFMKR